MKKPSTLFKKLIYLCCLLAYCALPAQTVSTAYASQINTTFAGVDKSRVPHKLLLDYAMEFADLQTFDGTLNNNNLVHKGNYTAIYNTLLMARVQTGVPDLVSPDTFRNNWNTRRSDDKIVLSGLYYKYSRFKDNAHPSYITVFNSRLYDKFVRGVWQNPYQEEQVFAISAPILKYKSKSLSVELPSALWYTNQAAAVQSIQIDFGDGQGYQNVPFGTIKQVNYNFGGFYEWKYKLTLTNNQVLYSHSKIHIDVISKPVLWAQKSMADRTINQPCTATGNEIDEVEFNGTQTYLGTANSATIEIDYALNDCTIRRPLIVAEGFDSGLLGMENGLGDTDYESFRRDATIGTGALAGEITDYDIIYINWDNGRDFLQRNALLLQDIIAWVNSEKADPNIQNVVLGQSMGGVIARYALADMEQRSLTHDTSLYISHDAPHQGANIPLGILYFARHMVDQFVSTPLGDMNINPNDGAAVSIEDIETLIDAPGTRQLLIQSVAGNFSVDTSLHDSWQAELQSKGYPQTTRNIAIGNGSHCAEPQDFNPSDTLFTLNGNGRTSFLTDFLLELLSPLGDLGFISLAVLFNEPGLLIGILPGNSKFNLDFIARALPAVGSTSQIYKGKITFTKRLLWFINITVTLTNRSYNNPSGSLPYDYYPGGIYNVPFDFQNTNVSGALGSFGISSFIIPGFGFIPTPSALDVGSGSATLNNFDYLRSYSAASPPTGSRAIPFDNFTTTFNNLNSNEAHITFNALSGDWLASELDTVANNEEIFDCTFVCGNTSISGDDVVCTSKSYQVNIPTGSDAIVTWSVSNSSAVSLSSSVGNPITLTAVAGYRTNITLTATVSSNTCNSATTLTKSIRIGKPGTPSSLSGPSTVLTGALVNYNAGPAVGATSYKWWLPYPFDVSSPINYFADNWQMAPTNHRNLTAMTGYAGNAGYVQVMGVNECGCGGARIMWVEHSSSGGGGIPRAAPESTDDMNTITIFPNPTSGVLNIQLNTNTGILVSQAGIEGTLSDLFGNVKRKVRITNGKTVISTKGLATGVYVLSVRLSDDTLENHQVIVK
ncbi:MAG: T9SS type A sorting domain-containing protein [Bacteroidota bacterium]